MQPVSRLLEQLETPGGVRIDTKRQDMLLLESARLVWYRLFDGVVPGS
jgi:hypothetical protein